LGEGSGLIAGWLLKRNQNPTCSVLTLGAVGAALRRDSAADRGV